MKSQLLTAVSVLLLSLQIACGPSESTDSETSALTCTDAAKNAPALKLPKAAGFKNARNYAALVMQDNHRSRDIITLKGKDAYLHAKFAYSLFDKDLKDEPVDIYVSVGCSSAFKKVGTALTSKEPGKTPFSADNVTDSGGRVFIKLSSLGLNNLPVGRHRVRFVVQGDNSKTDSHIDIIDPSQKIVVSDIDGTLTTSEFAAASDAIKVALSLVEAQRIEKLVKSAKPNPGAADMLKKLKAKGYKIFYLTARPEWLMPSTRGWLAANGFPEGSLHTTDLFQGAQGDAAKNYKIEEIRTLTKQTNIVPSFAFGNKESDVDAFAACGIPAAKSYFFKLEGDTKGGVNHSDYRKLNL